MEMNEKNLSFENSRKENTNTNDMDRLYRLDELDDFEVADDDPDVRGWEVYGQDGQKLGEVDELVVNPAQMKVRYLDIEVNEDLAWTDGERHLLVPIGEAELKEDDKAIWVNNVDSNSIRNFPAYNGGPITRDYENSLRNSYVGLNRSGTGTSEGEWAGGGRNAESSRQSGSAGQVSSESSPPNTPPKNKIDLGADREFQGRATPSEVGTSRNEPGIPSGSTSESTNTIRTSSQRAKVDRNMDTATRSTSTTPPSSGSADPGNATVQNTDNYREKTGQSEDENNPNFSGGKAGATGTTGSTDLHQNRGLVSEEGEYEPKNQRKTDLEWGDNTQDRNKTEDSWVERKTEQAGNWVERKADQVGDAFDGDDENERNRRRYEARYEANKNDDFYNDQMYDEKRFYSRNKPNDEKNPDEKTAIRRKNNNENRGI